MILSTILLYTMHPFWYDPFFYLFLVSLFVGTTFILVVMGVLKNKQKEIKVLLQQHSAKIDILSKGHVDKINDIRHEVSKREEDRLRQWSDSEKEMMHVLNNVFSILDINESITRNDSEIILKKLDEIDSRVKQLTVKE